MPSCELCGHMYSRHLNAAPGCLGEGELCGCKTFADLSCKCNLCSESQGDYHKCASCGDVAPDCRWGKGGSCPNCGKVASMETCVCGHDRDEHEDGGACREDASSGFRCACPSFVYPLESPKN